MERDQVRNLELLDMKEVVLAHEVDFHTWRYATRLSLRAKIPPEAIRWRVQNTNDKFVEPVFHQNISDEEKINISRNLMYDIMTLIQSYDPERFSLAYRLVYRVFYKELTLQETNDHDLSLLKDRVHDVLKETHHFRKIFSEFVALRECQKLFYENKNYIVEANADFCKARCAQLWEVQTQYRRMLWNGSRLFFGPGTAQSPHVTKAQWRSKDEGVWHEGFYPSQVLPPSRERVKEIDNLPELAATAMDCRSCELCVPACRTVFGVGKALSPMMLVGEQPGDQEDKAGVPFVGPAGQLLDQALEEAGIIRKESYITNAVKHFRFIDKNGRRLHQKPDEKHVMACYPWLEAERRLVKPKVIVMLGATAAHSLLKRSVTIARERSRLFSIEGAEKGLVTIHPSYLLRLPDERAQQQEYDRFVSDLTLARRFVESC